MLYSWMQSSNVVDLFKKIDEKYSFGKLLGEGVFKKVYQSNNCSDKVIVVSHGGIKSELMVYNKLEKIGVRIPKIYKVFDHLYSQCQIAIMEKLYPFEINNKLVLEESLLLDILFVLEHLEEKNLKIFDLQVMVDSYRHPVFIDPQDIPTTEMKVSYRDPKYPKQSKIDIKLYLFDNIFECIRFGGLYNRKMFNIQQSSLVEF